MKRSFFGSELPKNGPKRRPTGLCCELASPSDLGWGQPGSQGAPPQHGPAPDTLTVVVDDMDPRAGQRQLATYTVRITMTGMCSAADVLCDPSEFLCYFLARSTKKNFGPQPPEVSPPNPSGGGVLGVQKVKQSPFTQYMSSTLHVAHSKLLIGGRQSWAARLHPHQYFFKTQGGKGVNTHPTLLLCSYRLRVSASHGGNF